MSDEKPQDENSQDEKKQDDPSMEDILASIRRIITDDEAAETTAEDSDSEATPSEVPAPEEAPAEATPDAYDAGADGAQGDDVLELTQMVQDDGTTVDLSEKTDLAKTIPQRAAAMKAKLQA